jgi:hypothetical protein
MSDREPVSVWIERIRSGDQAAASKLWATYYDKLIRLVCHRIRGAKRRVSDEEDVVTRAFEAFFHRVKNGGLPELKEHEDLWQFLVPQSEKSGAR